MTIAPRLLSLTVALVLVFARSQAVSTQSPPSPSTSPAAPPTQGVATPPSPAAAPKGAAPAASGPQAAVATPTTTAPTASAAAGPELEPQGYTYSPEGRRDPFVSLLRRGSDTQKPSFGSRPAGLSGLETSEITLKGTIASQGSFVGILQGVDSKTYIVKAGDRLLDGTIRTITQDGMVITQQVTDPLSLEKQREVRKVLRQTEEAK